LVRILWSVTEVNAVFERRYTDRLPLLHDNYLRVIYGHRLEKKGDYQYQQHTKGNKSYV
jgi:hypothetical protein